MNCFLYKKDKNNYLDYNILVFRFMLRAVVEKRRSFWVKSYLVKNINSILKNKEVILLLIQ